MTDRQAELSRALALFKAGEPERGAELLVDLAEGGDSAAMFAVGDMYWRGVQKPLDHAQGRSWFRRSAEAGSPVAARACTNLLATGVAGERDWPQALARLRAEASTDSRRAQMLALIERMDLTPEGDPRTPPPGKRLIASPEVWGFRRLFTPEECRFLIEIAEPSYAASKVFGETREDYRDSIRTSDDAAIHWLIEDPATHALNRRLAAAAGLAYANGEPLLILRYRPGQEYRPHLDALPGVANPRAKTALVYLNQDYDGGETAFLKPGLQVKGRTGDAIVFTNVTTNGRPDPMAEHAGLPVLRGTKYLASRWIRAGRFLP